MELREKQKVDLSIVMTCLNEVNTVGICVREAFAFMGNHRISGEVLVVDNGSEDDSAAAAESAGAKVIFQPKTTMLYLELYKMYAFIRL